MSMTAPSAVVVLAAGEGTRMRSETPKVLHPVCGRPMLGHVLAAGRELAPELLIVVIGHARRQVADYLRRHEPDATVVVQHRQGGTGHAVRMVFEQLAVPPGTVIVTYADTPLLRGATLRGLAAAHERAGAAVTALTARVADPSGYGRILRDTAGSFAGIVEEADATAAQREISEINTGMYAADSGLLADAVKRLSSGNAKGEEYLTDIVAILRGDGHVVATAECADPAEVLGVNDQVQLARARYELNGRLLRGFMLAGATVTDPASTWIDVGVVLAPGARVEPATQLEGQTTVAAGATVGPGCLLRDTTVGEGARVVHSVCESAVIGAGAVVGPFAHLAGTFVADGATLAAGSRSRREGLVQ